MDKHDAKIEEKEAKLTFDEKMAEYIMKPTCKYYIYWSFFIVCAYIVSMI